MPPAVRYLLEPRPYPALLSIVVPCYNEQEVLPLLERELTAFAAELRCTVEFVLVNDGSRDGTLAALVEWARRDARVVVIELSRNFGHQLACTAGMEHARGDAVVLIDADLQDPPAVVHRMLEQYVLGYDVVYGQRLARGGEGWFKRATAWFFYRLMRALVYRDLPLDTGDFRLVSRACLDGVIRMQECHRFLRGMITWVGYPQVAVPYERNRRAAGSSKYPFVKMLRFAWTAATSFSTVPLNVAFVLGGTVGLFALEELVRALITSYEGRNVPGWTSLMVVVSAIGSAVLLMLGVLGQYIGKLYEQAKQRPLYIVARTYTQNPDQRRK